ncbi:MAG: type IX secretion system membrane protein PorP/SprF [Bacteroidales bacterium]
MRLSSIAIITILLSCTAPVTGPGMPGTDRYRACISCIIRPNTGTARRSRTKHFSIFLFPGKGFGLRSVYASFDGYFSSLHGGAGVWISDDMLGDIMNDLRGGASYAYHFRAGRDVYVTAGLTASVITRGIRAGSVILPDDIDPIPGYYWRRG